MARFRAYYSDSDEESRSDDVIDVEQAEENGSSEPGSSLQHEELSGRRRLGAAESDVYSDEEEVGDQDLPSRESSISPQPASARPSDPTLIPWARELGVDRQKMHVMQTSLFRVPEEEAALKSISQQPAPTSSKRLTLRPSLTRKHSRDSDGDGLRADSRQRASFAQDIDPAPFKPTRKYARVESSASEFSGHEEAFIDSGLALGRSFNVTWGPGGRMAHLGSLCIPYGTPSTSAATSILHISSLPTLSKSKDDSLDYASKLLSHNLSHTAIHPDEEGVPCANPSRELNFASFASLFPQTDRSFEATLFRLGQALFDPIELNLGSSISVDIRNRISALRRRIAFSRWLQMAVASAVETDVQETSGEYSWAQAVFALLTGYQVEKAVDIATEAGNVKLATLLAQADGDVEFKEDLKAQLALWREERIDVHIDESVRKVYALLAGVVDVLEGSKGVGLERCADVHLAKGLDWKRAFGLHLWYNQSMDAPISSAFEAYDRARKEDPQNVAAPLPWYRESASDVKTPWKLPPGAEPPDALFSLIRMFADPACSLSSVLTPLSFSPSPLDHRLPWHLYILVSRCLRIRDLADRGDVVDERRDGDEEAEAAMEPEVEGHSPSADLLASSYALQLEAAGMLQEAVFVLLHIEGSAGRKRAIKEMLSRNAPRLDDWMTRGLVGSLKIPIAWVNEAKATHALDNGEVYTAYELYLSAGLYNPAHDLAVLELAPDAVIHRDLELLKDIFERFEGRSVDDWQVRGKIFLDYAHAMTRMPELRDYVNDIDALPDEACAAEVEELSRTVPKMISMLPDILRDRSDTRHNAALAEMISGLAARLDQLRPLALGTHLRGAKVAEATKLHHIRAVAHEKFLRTIEVA
ncbi:Nup96 domain-containing protein [Phanerochaete sordida]|uniref:Nup96 domain-containing protein n=1 Tax=Phanerochaete sordida TaxID=48140 RepID=A0A9P3FZI7_9APHY|nr:Nup96 domain-containing protein [Phanerochaete sordida]